MSGVKVSHARLVRSLLAAAPDGYTFDLVAAGIAINPSL